MSGHVTLSHHPGVAHRGAYDRRRRYRTTRREGRGEREDTARGGREEVMRGGSVTPQQRKHAKDEYVG